MPFKVVSQKGFIKGVIASMDRFSTPKGAIERASNLLMTGRGALHACDGTALQSKLLGAPGPILELGLYIDPNFAATKLALLPNSPTQLGLYSWLGSGGAGDNLSLIANAIGPFAPWLPLTSGWQQPQLVNFAGAVVISLGNGFVPWAYGPNPPGSATAPVLTQLTAQAGGAGGGAPWLPNHFYSIGDRITAVDNNGPPGKNATYQVASLTIQAPSQAMASGSQVGGGGLSGTVNPFPPGIGGVVGTGSTVGDNQLLWMEIKEDPDLGKEAVPIGAAHIISHANSLWAWNTSPTNTEGSTLPGPTIDGPSVLRASGSNNYNSWPLGNAAYIGKDDGQQGTGIGVFTIAEAGIAPTGALVLFKDYSTYQVTGKFNADFQVTQVKTDMGCLAGRTVQFATGFGLIRFCHLGFALFDGVNDRLISEEIRPYIFGNNADIIGIDFTNATLGRAMLTANPPLYVCMMPTIDGLRTRMFVYDLVMRAWMIVDYLNGAAPVGIGASWPITTLKQLRLPQTQSAPGPPMQGVHSYICDRNSGNDFIRQWEQGDPAWDATNPPTPVAWSFQPPDVGEPASRAYYRRANVRLTAATPGVVKGAFAIGAAQPPSTTQPEIGASPSSGAPPNTVAVGVYNGKQDFGVALDVNQTGPSLSSTFSGSGPTVIEGVDWHVMPKNPRPFTKVF